MQFKTRDLQRTEPSPPLEDEPVASPPSPPCPCAATCTVTDPRHTAPHVSRCHRTTEHLVTRVTLSQNNRTPRHTCHIVTEPLNVFATVLRCHRTSEHLVTRVQQSKCYTVCQRRLGIRSKRIRARLRCAINGYFLRFNFFLYNRSVKKLHFTNK